MSESEALWIESMCYGKETNLTEQFLIGQLNSIKNLTGNILIHDVYK